MNDEEMIDLKTYKIKELCKKVIEDIDKEEFKNILEVFEIHTETDPNIILDKRIELDEKYLSNMMNLAAELEEFDYIINLLLKKASVDVLNNVKVVNELKLEEDSGVGKDE